MYILPFLSIQHTDLSVPCGIGADCASIRGRSICKQDDKGKKTCQPPTECEASCGSEQFCAENGTCIETGKVIFKAKNGIICSN